MLSRSLRASLGACQRHCGLRRHNDQAGEPAELEKRDGNANLIVFGLKDALALVVERLSEEDEDGDLRFQAT